MPGIRDHRTARPAAMESQPAPTQAAPVHAARPAPVARAKPDARPLRIAYGMVALAATTALVTALATPPPAGAAAGSATDVAQTTTILPAEPAQPVKHVIQYVQLKPGQTAPPNAIVKVVPTPKPRVVTITTRQSGAKP